MSDPKRYHLVTDGFLESEMRPCDDCLAHDEIAEEQEYIRYEDYALLKAEVDQLTYVDDFIVITRASIKELAEEGVQNTPGQYDEKYTISVTKACYIKVLKHMSEFWEAKKNGGQS